MITARPHLLALGAVVALGLIAAFAVRDAVVLDLVFTLLLYAALGQSWNWISGYAGNISFGHAIFFGCGAYASALCVTHGLSPWLAIPAGALAAAVLALIAGFPTLGLRGHYFSIATIAVAALVEAFVRNAPWFGKANGFELPIASGWAAMQFPEKGPYVVLALALFAAVQLATIALERSRLGYYLRALRANHAAAASVGIDERRFKLIAFAWSAVMAAAAGVLYAQYTLFVDPPSTIALGISIDIALIGVVGGIGTLWGPAAGAVVYVVLAKAVALKLGGAGKGYDLVIYGAIICLIAALRPYGIVGTIVDALRRRRGALAATPPGAVSAVLVCAAVLAAVGPARAAAPPIDTALAVRIFAERQAECDRDRGRLWGVSLCGPLLFVDPASRAVVANRDDAALHAVAHDGVFAGTLPPSVLPANTAFTLGGRLWTMVTWPLPEDPVARQILVAHESWHRVQDALGLPASSPPNDHLDTAEGRYWVQLEWRALARALTSTGAARAEAVNDALDFRAQRVSLFPDAGSNENALMLNEGLAEDTGIAFTTQPRDRVARAVESLSGGRRRASFVRSFAYASGPAYGALLDAAVPEWRRALNAHSDMAALLAAAYRVSPDARGAVLRAGAYDDGSLRVAENDRAARLAVRLAQYRAAFVDGPVLRIPLRDAAYSFDPNQVTAFPPQGSVYGGFAGTGWFGRIEAPDGALLTNDHAIVVAAPPNATTMETPAWKLVPAAGCAVVPAEHTRDFTIACGAPK
ncbi:MAG TPA: branched-chain amino acid ABC transporter permease [Candidatus Elarobacter sp.]|jgi:ABC-type branched-subunit amino acid transport system permease subunit|nr:branched-chain amino acid ABC transporter permease [Candidatus Elarobacter sp.]